MTIYTVLKIIHGLSLLGLVWLVLDVAWDTLTDDERERNQK
jgi:hypothetical protein